MSYILAKKCDGIGCIALQIEHGEGLVNLKKRILSRVEPRKIELIVISRPDMYGEYAPYNFVDEEQKFEDAAVELAVSQ